MSMNQVIRRYINSIGVTGTVMPLQGVLNYLMPDSAEVGLTAHSGGTQAAALKLSSTTAWHEVATVAAGTDSVALPKAKKGELHFVANAAAANAMQVFGQDPDTIDGVATGTGISMTAGTGKLFACLVDGKYVSF